LCRSDHFSVSLSANRYQTSHFFVLSANGGALFNQSLLPVRLPEPICSSVSLDQLANTGPRLKDFLAPGPDGNEEIDATFR
jgi:hypothetical protein